MNNKLLGYIGIVLVVLLLFDIGFGALKNQRNEVAENKVAQGELMKGHEVDFETEKKLSDESLEQAEQSTKDEAEEQFIYTFHYCIGAKNYMCLTNLMSNEMLDKYSDAEISEGEALYKFFSKNQAITGLSSTNVLTENDVTTYEMNVNLLNKKYPVKYKVAFKDNHIIESSEEK